MKNNKVLIVDDDIAVRKSISYMLTEKGYIVEEAGDGNEALVKVELIRPELVILDNNMPVMNGTETIAKLRSNEETKDISIIVCSAKEVQESIEEGVKGCYYLKKPFSMSELYIMICRILME